MYMHANQLINTKHPINILQLMKKYTRFIFLIHDHIGNFNNFVFSLLMWELYYSPIHYGSSNDITVTDIHSELAQEATLLGNLLYVEG